MIRCWSAGRQSLFSFMIKNNKNGEIKLNKTKTRPENKSVREILCLLFFRYSLLDLPSPATSALDVSALRVVAPVLVSPVLALTKTEVLSCLSEMNVADIRTCSLQRNIINITLLEYLVPGTTDPDNTTERQLKDGRQVGGGRSDLG